MKLALSIDRLFKVEVAGMNGDGEALVRCRPRWFTRVTLCAVVVLMRACELLHVPLRVVVS